jgi:hypothetical protein
MSRRPQQQQSIDRGLRAFVRPTLRALPHSALIGAPEAAYATMSTFIQHVETSPQPQIKITTGAANTATVRIVGRVVAHHMEPQRGMFGWRVQLLHSTIPHTNETTVYSLYWRCILQYPQGDQRNRQIPMVTDIVELKGIPKNLAGTHSIRVTVQVGLLTIDRFDSFALRQAERIRWRRVVEIVFLGLHRHRGNQLGWTADTIRQMSDLELLAAVEFDPYVMDADEG